jgi:hypothetical protein
VAAALEGDYRPLGWEPQLQAYESPVSSGFTTPPTPLMLNVRLALISHALLEAYNTVEHHVYVYVERIYVGALELTRSTGISFRLMRGGKGQGEKAKPTVQPQKISSLKKNGLDQRA